MLQRGAAVQGRRGGESRLAPLTGGFYSTLAFVEFVSDDQPAVPRVNPITRSNGVGSWFQSGIVFRRKLTKLVPDLISCPVRDSSLDTCREADKGQFLP